MCPESFGDIRFDLGALLVGRMWSVIPIMVYITLYPGIHCVKTQYLVTSAKEILNS